MRAKKIILPIFFFALAVAARASEFFAVLKVGGTVYSNVTVTSSSATDIYFTHAGGLTNVKIERLSADLQKHFNFDPEKAEAEEITLAGNNAKYHAQLLAETKVLPPELAHDSATNTTAAAAVWLTDFPAVLKQAQADKKRVLLNFTGSDWSAWGIKFDQEVFATDRFAAYAATNLVLLKVDFPHRTAQDDILKHNNAALKETFKVSNFPTYVLLDADGTELGRQNGYIPGGPDAFIKELQMFANH